MKRVIVTGDRNWKCFALAHTLIGRMAARYPSLVVVHGAATGVDTAFHEACLNWSVAAEPHPADWKAHGKGAGPKRNAEMVAAGADFAVAVHKDLSGSKGTKDCVSRCLAAGIPVYLIDSEDAEPRRITKI